MMKAIMGIGGRRHRKRRRVRTPPAPRPLSERLWRGDCEPTHSQQREIDRVGKLLLAGFHASMEAALGPDVMRVLRTGRF